jgi:CheY-like chemotaxis protein
MAHEYTPDVAVLDIAMPSLNGLETARRLRETFPQTKIVLLTMHTEEPYVLALQRHFSGFAKFALVESRFCGRKRRGKAAFDVPANLCVRSVCSRSVAVGLEALQAGAVGYVLKTQAAGDIVQAIRDALQGAIYLSSRVGHRGAMVDDLDRFMAPESWEWFEVEQEFYDPGYFQPDA